MGWIFAPALGLALILDCETVSGELEADVMLNVESERGLRMMGLAEPVSRCGKSGSSASVSVSPAMFSFCPCPRRKDQALNAHLQ